MQWLWYINPNAYTIQAMGTNALTSPKWAAPSSSAPGAPSIGIATLESFGMYTSRRVQFDAVAPPPC
jgi:hypothetical protein